MKISKRQLERIIKEEYTKLKNQGLISEMRDGYGDPEDISDMFDAGETDYYEGQYGDSLPPNASPEMKSAYDDGFATGKHEDTYADNYEPEDYLRPYGKSVRTTPMDESRIARAVRRRRIVESYGNPDEYITNMEMGIGYSDAEEMELYDMDKLFQAVNDIQRRNFNYEDLAMAPDEVIQRLIMDSEPIFELAMEATYGEGYDQSPLSDRWRGFMIALLSMGR